MKKQNGFTLIELMITIAVAGVLLGLALPNMRDYIMASRVTSATNDVVFMMALGKSEAIKRRVKTELVPAQGTDKSINWQNWSKGMRLVVNPGPSEVVIKTLPAIDTKGVSIKSEFTSYKFNTFGLLEGPVESRFVVCGKGLDIHRQRQLKISKSGRAKVDALTNKRDCK